ncbi:hypothetical protein CBS147354_4218 [Penicillium roqueforti]|nr:hypothetical protein CBS147354_4218 [Penicillium roqueforti]KAI3284537.1 hypothetical protein DTO002I6_9109 [Penicillium roqueforti]
MADPDKVRILESYKRGRQLPKNILQPRLVDLYDVTEKLLWIFIPCVPIHESIQILETRQQLNDMARQYPLGTMDDRNGGYYLLDHDDTVLAIASDPLCEELDAAIEAAERYRSAHSEIDDESEFATPTSK